MLIRSERMPTYKEIQEYVKGRYNFSVKSCWIAHVKEQCELPVRRASNRYGEKRKYPCPADKKNMIKDAFRYFGMIE